jgi:hypothetical protein
MHHQRARLLPVFVVLLLLSTVLSAVDTLPARLADEAFWRLVESSSEPGGTFESENWISNETGIQSVIPRLKQLTTPGGAYIGVGPEQNFTYIAALRPKIAFIIDIRRQNTLQQLVYKAVFETSADRAAFLSRLFSREQPAGLTAGTTVDDLFAAYGAARANEAAYKTTLQAVKETLLEKHRFALTPDDVRGVGRILTVFREFGPNVNYNSGRNDGVVTDLPGFAALMTARDTQGQQQSFLASEDNYRSVRDLQLRNLIVPVTGDFGGPKAVRAVGKYLKDHGATVAAFYVSNVETYLFRTTENPNGGAKNFYDNVAALPLDSSSTFIRSWSGGGPVPPGGMAITLLSPINETLGAVRAGRAQTARDVFRLSK